MIGQAFSSPTCFTAASVLGPDKIFLIAVFLSIAAGSLFFMKRTNSTPAKLGAIYAHLLFLFAPFVLLTTNATCGLFCLTCHNNIPALLMYAMPTAVGASAVAGLVVIPTFYTLTNNRPLKNEHVKGFVTRYARKLDIREPALYVVNKARPVAFSFRSLRSAIFLSSGAFAILNRKELEAVLLHELAHIRHRSSQLKFSHRLMSIFSPFSRIAGFHDTGREERIADDFAAREQGTGAHLMSAKRKIEEFEKLS